MSTKTSRSVFQLLLYVVLYSNDAEEDDAVLPPSPYELEEEGWTGSDDHDYVPFDGECVMLLLLFLCVE